MSVFSLSPAAEVRLGPDSLTAASDWLSARSVSDVFVLADPFMASSGVTGRLADSLSQSGISMTLFTEFSAEPTLDVCEAATSAARTARADAIIGLGGGSALDMAKIVGVAIAGGGHVSDYVMQAQPLPTSLPPRIAIPTTAGTGSEASGTNIVMLENGRKGWVWGEETKPDLILLDPELSTSLPAHLTACTGMDAIVHAFEAATNKYSHSGARLYAHQALRLAATALPRAVVEPDNLDARSDMLLASYYAGRAIDMCSCSIAHALSHACAALAPVHHGLATALSFEVSLPMLTSRPSDLVEQAAQAFGGCGAGELPEFLSDFFDRIELKRELPAAFGQIDIDEFMALLGTDEIAPIRAACAIWADDQLMASFARKLFSYARS